MEEFMRDLIRDFVEKTKNGFYESVYEKFSDYLESSFEGVVEECCKIVLFGREYSLSARELYNFDRCLATEAWFDHVENRFGDFRDWVSEVVQDDLEDFTNGFQQWLASQDERTSDAIVALMIGDVDLTEIVVDWLYDRLRSEDWDYLA